MGDMGSEDKLAPHNPVPLRLHSVDEMGPFTKITYVLNPGYLVSVPEPEEGLGQLGLCSASSPLRCRPDLGSPEPFTVMAVFLCPYLASTSGQVFSSGLQQAPRACWSAVLECHGVRTSPWGQAESGVGVVVASW